MDHRLSDAGWPMKIGDQEYKACMLTDRDYGDLSRYIQSVYLDNAFAAADLNEDSERQFQLRKFALSEVSNVGWNTLEGVRIMATKIGILHIGHQMIRKRHSNITFPVFRVEAEKDIVRSLTEINLVDKQLNYVKQEDGESGGTSTENDKSE